MRPCACGCGGWVAADAAGWRAECVTAILLDVRKLQNLSPGEIVILAGIFQLVDAQKLAQSLTGALPFEPGAETLERLNDK